MLFITPCLLALYKIEKCWDLSYQLTATKYSHLPLNFKKINIYFNYWTAAMYHYFNCMSVTASRVCASLPLLQQQQRCTPTNIDASPALTPYNQSASLSASKYSVDDTPKDTSRSVVLPDAYYSIDRTPSTPIRGRQLRQQCEDIICTLNFQSPSQLKPKSAVFCAEITAAITDCVSCLFEDSTGNSGFSRCTSPRPTPIGASHHSSKSGLSKHLRPAPIGSTCQPVFREQTVTRPTPIGSTCNSRRSSFSETSLTRPTPIGSSPPAKVGATCDSRRKSYSAFSMVLTKQSASVGGYRTSLKNLVKLRRSISQTSRYTTHQTLAVLWFNRLYGL